MEAIGRAVKKQHRLACNINQFTRVVVELNEDSAPLEITVDRSSTISYLSQQIEAEHWFCRVLPSLERLDPEKRERILAEMDPISVEQIYTERNLALRFDDSIGKMLSYGERIYVLASGQGNFFTVFHMLDINLSFYISYTKQWKINNFKVSNNS